jgi:hypothetical protein
MGTKGTNSNVAWQLQNSDTGGHETNDADQRETVARRFQPVEEGCCKEMAGCCHDEFRNCVGTCEDFGSRGSTEGQKVKHDRTKSQVLQKQSQDLNVDQGLDLTVPLGTIGGYVDLKGVGKLGRIQKLWGRYCGLRLQIDKLETKIEKIRQGLLQEDASFFDSRNSLVGPLSFPFRPRLEEMRKHGFGIAARIAVIRRASPRPAHQICQTLRSYGFPVPRGWKKRFPGVENWVQAYENTRCRPLVQKLISEAKAH